MKITSNFNAFPKKKITTSYLVRAAFIAAIYVGLTFVVYQLSFGAVQFRLSECLTVLPLLMPEALPGLAIGCLIANTLTFNPWDIFLGTAATLIAALMTRYSRKIYFGVLPPIILNALIVPVIIIMSSPDPVGYWATVLSVGIGQATVIILAGIPLYFGVRRILPLPLMSGTIGGKKRAPIESTVKTDDPNNSKC